MNENPKVYNVVPFARDAGFLRTRAQGHARAGRMLEALELYRMAAERAPDNALRQLELAAQYGRMGAYELSNRILFSLLQRGEHVAAVFFTLGSNFYAVQDAWRAQDCLLALAQIQPEGEFSEQSEEMMDQLDELLTSEHGQGRAGKAMLRGIAALEAGQADAAVRWIGYAVQHGGADAEGMAMLAFAHIAGGDAREGLIWARRARRRSRHSVPALCAMACAFYALGNPLLCARYLDFAEEEAELPQEMALLCQSACETGSHDLVLSLLRRVHASQPYVPGMLHMMAAACWNTGQLRQAAQYWGTLTRLDPDNLTARILHERARQRAAEGGDLQEPPGPEELCNYNMELSVEDTIDQLFSVQRAIHEGPEGLQRRFDADTELAALLAWGLTVRDAEDGTRRAMLSLLAHLRGERADRILLAQLTEAGQSEEIRREALGLLALRGLDGPFYMECGGRIVRAVGRPAGGNVSLPRNCERVLQAAVDRMTPRYGDVVCEASDLWLAYARDHLREPVHRPQIWVAALECAFRIMRGLPPRFRQIAAQASISSRTLRRHTRKLLGALAMSTCEREESGI